MAQMPGLKEALTPIATEMGLQANNATLAKLALEGLDPAVESAALGMEDGAAAAGEFEEGLEGATGEMRMRRKLTTTCWTRSPAWAMPS